MIKKLALLMIISASILALAGCAAAGTAIRVTSVPTSIPPTAMTAPSATPIPPTETPTPIPPTPTATTAPVNVIAHYPSGQEFSVTQIHMVDTTHGWAIGSLGAQVGDHVLFTSDGGNTWQDVTPPAPEAATDQNNAALGYFQDVNNAWVTFFIGGGTPVPSSPVVWHTTDGGATWAASQPLDVNGLSEFFVPSVMQFVGESGWMLVHVGAGMNHDYVVIYRSNDGGNTWNRILDPYNDGGIQSCTKNNMLFTDATHGWLTGDCNGVKAGVLLFKSADAGSTWQPVTLPEPANAPGIFSIDSNYACGSYDPFFFGNDLAHLSVRCANYGGSTITYSYYIYTTQDGGNTWTSATYPGEALYFVSADTGWALASKIQLTTDGGKTWKPVSDVTWTAQFDFVSEQFGWAIAQADNEVALVKSDNGGARWSILVPTVK
jgi:photosystem II stability/assembly factor-like uncharacterized protein